MYSINDYVVYLVKSLPKDPVDFSKPAADQIDYEDHEKIVDALHRGIENGRVEIYTQAWDMRERCEYYVMSVMMNDARLNPITEKVESSKPDNSDFILNKLVESLNETDPESLLFDQIERAIEKRRNIVNSRVSETNSK